MPAGLLPEGVRAGPDATALGQVYWYTIEGRDKREIPQEAGIARNTYRTRFLCEIWIECYRRCFGGVIGGFVQEYQIDVNPDALKAYDIPLHKVMEAVQKSNRDESKNHRNKSGRVPVRGLGYVKKTEDIEKAVVAVQENVPIRIKDIGVVSLGPATRRGALDKDGAEVVGGVVVARYGANPLQVINNVKDKIKKFRPGCPKKLCPMACESQLTIIPFYDRSGLIQETLGTLEEAISLQILIVILVVIVMVFNLRASFLISSLLPIAVLMVFIAMRYFHVDITL